MRTYCLRWAAAPHLTPRVLHCRVLSFFKARTGACPADTTFRSFGTHARRAFGGCVATMNEWTTSLWISPFLSCAERTCCSTNSQVLCLALPRSATQRRCSRGRLARCRDQPVAVTSKCIRVLLSTFKLILWHTSGGTRGRAGSVHKAPLAGKCGSLACVLACWPLFCALLLLNQELCESKQVQFPEKTARGASPPQPREKRRIREFIWHRCPKLGSCRLRHPRSTCRPHFHKTGKSCSDRPCQIRWIFMNSTGMRDRKVMFACCPATNGASQNSMHAGPSHITTCCTHPCPR